MMRAGSLPARRRFELIRLAQRQGQLSVAELSSQFGVSADTIRRDLDLLSMGGFVRRTHGESVILNGGSTTRLFAFELGSKKDLTVVTNSLGIPAALSRHAVRDIVVLGGEY